MGRNRGREHKRTYYLDVTFRKSDDMRDMEREIERLRKQVERLNSDMHAFSLYAAQNLRLFDDLKQCKRLLEEQGIDTSFIQVQRLYKR